MTLSIDSGLKQNVQISEISLAFFISSFKDEQKCLDFNPPFLYLQPIVQWLNLPGHKSLELSTAIDRGPALLVLAPVNYVYRTNFYLNMVGIHDSSSPNGYWLFQCKKYINDNASVAGKGIQNKKFMPCIICICLVPSYHDICICILYSFYKNALKDFFVICQGHVSIFYEIAWQKSQCKIIFYTVVALQVL